MGLAEGVFGLDASRRFADQISAAGGTYIEAPVSGSATQASLANVLENGRIIVSEVADAGRVTPTLAASTALVADAASHGDPDLDIVAAIDYLRPD